jgi:hypothetical protein
MGKLTLSHGLGSRSLGAKCNSRGVWSFSLGQFKISQGTRCFLLGGNCVKMSVFARKRACSKIKFEKSTDCKSTTYNFKVCKFREFRPKSPLFCAVAWYNRSVVYGCTAGRKRTMQVELAAPVLKPTVETKANAQNHTICDGPDHDVPGRMARIGSDCDFCGDGPRGV